MSDNYIDHTFRTDILEQTELSLGQEQKIY